MDSLIFSLGLLIINLSLFLPAYFIFKDQNTTFFPQLLSSKRKLRPIFWTDRNQDPFRVSLDVSALVFLVGWMKIEFIAYILPAYYTFIQLYNLYHYIFLKVYGTHPVIINDLKLIATGVGFIYGESKSKVILGIIFVVCSLLAATHLLDKYLLFALNSDLSLVVPLAGLLLLLIYCYKIYLQKLNRSIGNPSRRFHVFPLRILYNLKISLALLKNNTEFINRLKQLDNERLNLKRKPNIHFICIESYGGILLQHGDLKNNFAHIQKKFNQGLSEVGYYSISHLSESISHVGPSWLCYTTLLLGTRVAFNYQYQYALNNLGKDIHSLPKQLQKDGYYSYNLNPIEPHAGIPVPYERIRDLYGIDQYILYKDIPYEGKRYGIGNTPPEQFVLKYAHENFLKKGPHPYFVFYLTKNSHSPFKSPMKIEEEWRSLNIGKDELIGKAFLQSPTVEDYMSAINYQLDAMLDYIRGFEDSPEENIFILIGDHQPHDIVHSSNYGVETPIHIIAKDKGFVDEFKKSGFKYDLNQIDTFIKHEDIRKILQSAMMAHFS